MLEEALVEQFEFAQSIQHEVDTDEGRVTFRVVTIVRFDHPVASFLASGLSARLEELVVSVEPNTEEGDWMVVCDKRA